MRHQHKFNLMNGKLKILILSGIAVAASATVQAQSFSWNESTEGNEWKTSKVTLKKQQSATPDVKVNTNEPIVTFSGWGITFNELDWDALSMLTRDEQHEILYKVFSPQGELRATRGRVSMGANDYARSWYSCDEVPGWRCRR